MVYLAPCRDEPRLQQTAKAMIAIERFHPRLAAVALLHGFLCLGAAAFAANELPVNAATAQPKYREAARAQVENLLRQPRPEDSFRALGEFATEFPEDPLVSSIKPAAERRVADLQKLCAPPFGLVRSPTAAGLVYFPAYADVNDWYVGGTMRHLDVATEGAMAAHLGVSAGRRLAENQVHWILGRNPFSVSLMEGVGSRFVPNYHHRYNTIPGNPRGAVPGALLNGIVRSWPHQDRPWLDLTPEPNADYHSNEPWLPHNNRWLLLLSVW